MKTDWERTTAALEPPRPVLEALVARHVPGRRLIGSRLLSGGLANTNLHLRLDGGDLVLRIYQRAPAERAKEVALARRLASVIPVADFVAEGGPDDLLGHAWAMMRWVDGEPMDALAVPGRGAELVEAAGQAGAVLARIQAITMDAPGVLGPRLETAAPLEVTADAFRGWLDDALHARGAAARLPAELARRVERFAGAWTPLLDGLTGERSLVHCDYNGANLLVRHAPEGWRVSAVLDWEFAMAGTSLWDMANMLRHYADRGAGVSTAFEVGFRDAGGRLPENWRPLAGLLDIMNLADMMAGTPAGSGRERSMVASIAAHLEASEG